VSRFRAALVALALAIAICAVCAAPAAAESRVATLPQNLDKLRAQLPTPDPLSPLLYLPETQTKPPPSFAISAVQAIRIAERTKAVQSARRQYGRIKPTAYISPLPLRQGRFYHWDVLYTGPNRKYVAEVEMGRTGVVFETETGPDVGWSIQRGYPGILGGKLNAPYVWLPLCVLFLLPFMDPRRPFRLLHLDLLVLLGFGLSHYYFAAGRPGVSVPLAYPFLLYVVIRLAAAGFRPRRRDGPLMPFVSTGFLGLMIVLLLGMRIAFGFIGSETTDVGVAGVIGADRVEHGLPLYQDNMYHGDTYGPINYIAYLPFELLVPYHPGGDPSPSVEPSTLAFDALIVIGLLLLGRRLRPGRAGIRLGAGLAYAWTAYPYTSLVIASNTNDALVPLFIVYALLVLRSPPGRGLLTGLASMAKLSPLLVAPILVAGTRPFRRGTVVAGAVFAAFCAGLLLAFLPDGGWRELWNTTLGFQAKRESPLALWTRHPDLDWLRTLSEAVLVALAGLAAILPRKRTVGQVAALCGAVLAMSQIPANYWIYFYLVWFAPFMFIALFQEYRSLGGPEDQDSATRSLVNPLRISQPEGVTTTRSSILTPSEPGR
jgi:hypothetical protein